MPTKRQKKTSHQIPATTRSDTELPDMAISEEKPNSTAAELLAKHRDALRLLRKYSGGPEV
jgi:hypothetical protein